MNNIDIRVKLTPERTAEVITDQIVNGSVSGELIDRYSAVNENDHTLIVLVFEKYYMRNSSRASLTVTIENLDSVTKVHAVGSGGGQGLFLKFDWGAGNHFGEQVEKALQAHMY